MLYQFVWRKCVELEIDPKLVVDAAINNMLTVMDAVVSTELKIELLNNIKDKITLEESHNKGRIQ